MRRLQQLRKEDAVKGGYFTIEATVIVFLVCVITIGIWILAVYFFDLGYIQSRLNLCVTELASEKGGNVEKKKVELEEEFNKQLIFGKIQKISIKETPLYYTGEAVVSMIMPVPVLSEFLGHKWEQSIFVKVEKGNSGERMRRWDVFE